MKHYPTDYYRDKMASSQKVQGSQGEMVSENRCTNPFRKAVKGIKGGFKMF